VALVIFRGSREMLCCDFTQSSRFIEEDDWAKGTFCQLNERARPGFSGGPKERGRLPGGNVQIRLSSAGTAHSVKGRSVVR